MPLNLKYTSGDDVRLLHQLGYSVRAIAELCGCKRHVVKAALRGAGTRRVRHRMDSAPSPVSPERYVLMRPLAHSVPVAEDHDPPHGPVRQLMRGGTPVNEIVWRPKG